MSKIIKNVRENDILRESFFKLAKETYGIPFKEWYEQGYWTDKYMPYAIVEGNEIVANASVNRIKFNHNGKIKNCVQVGTVMTKPSHRNKGLSRMLMKEIIADWRDKSDLIYLFANDSVVEFYPKFGFEKRIEEQYLFSVDTQKSDFIKLDVDNEIDKKCLFECYKKGNPFSKFEMIDNIELVMFYCSSVMKESIYYSKKHNTAVIGVQENEEFICYDVFGDSKASLTDLLAEVVNSNVKRVVLGFTPKDITGMESSIFEMEDTTLFELKNDSSSKFKENEMFPLLSYA
ncbi:GNAT family N-acetyltransferase [Peptostreptococcus faecalis]|uniref:GNAT family N-acetyltransferase n=1 Tax=Peptostreptococcus faecalis TaxID=2045015 RepID=UPI000C7A8D9C|nr:GNAT family N-acetyltransferase [Peptostreptococcus faecalis]